MGKLLLLYLLFRLFGHPIIAIVIIILIYYFVDRRFIGLLPNIAKPFRRQARISYLKKQLNLNPHDMSARYDLATIYMERRQYAVALELLESLTPTMKESTDVLYDSGVCLLAIGNINDGEQRIEQALQLNPGLRYGEPYIRLADAFANVDATKALAYVREIGKYNLSSCEAYYRLGEVYERLHNKAAAREAFQQCLRTYRSLPKFRKRHERIWALRARFKS